MWNNNVKRWRVGSVLLMLAAVVYLMCEAITAAAWVDPPYKYHYNFISDLGVPVVMELQGRILNSPLQLLMRFAFILQGVLFVAGYSLGSDVLPKNRRKAGIFLAATHTVGIIMVALFPGYEYRGLPLHMIGAVLAIPMGNVALLYTGLSTRHSASPKWFPIISIALGAIGITGFAACIVFLNYQYVAFFERIAAYTIIAWEVLFGVLLLARSQGKANALSV